MDKGRRFVFALFVLFGAATSTGAQTEIDRYGALITDDEFGHLSYLVDRLKADPKAFGTIDVFKDKRETVGGFLRHFYGVKAFMKDTFGIPPTRFGVIYGGEEVRRTVIYLSLVGGANKLKGVVLDETLGGKITKRTLFDETCIDCDLSPFINQFIFREGIDHLAKVLLANPNSYSEIVISRVEYLSGTVRERRKLSAEIYDRLAQNGVPDRGRVSLRFVKGSDARVYIIPGKPIRRHKPKQI